MVKCKTRKEGDSGQETILEFSWWAWEWPGEKIAKFRVCDENKTWDPNKMERKTLEIR